MSTHEQYVKDLEEKVQRLVDRLDIAQRQLTELRRVPTTPPVSPLAHELSARVQREPALEDLTERADVAQHQVEAMRQMARDALAGWHGPSRATNNLTDVGALLLALSKITGDPPGTRYEVPHVEAVCNEAPAGHEQTCDRPKA